MGEIAERNAEEQISSGLEDDVDMAEKQSRLDKFLAESAGFTRKEAKTVLSKGRVRVNGAVCKNADAKVTSEDEVLLDGERLGATKGFMYLMLHKPAGVVSATEDGRDRTVLDIVREKTDIGKRELFPVGRLDKDTEGLLVLTDDGELSHRLLSPKRHVDKVYYAQLDGLVPEDAKARFAEGIQVGQEYKAMPAGLETLHLDETKKCSQVQITLREGKFHQVKRMCHEIGCEVTYLKRLSMGSLLLDPALAPGECRPLSEEEIAALRNDAGLE